MKFKLANFQFHFLPPSNLQTHGPVFIIDDGSQPKIELASKDRNVIAATFTHFLLKNIGGSETFKDKQDFFYYEVFLILLQFISRINFSQTAILLLLKCSRFVLYKI